MNTHQWTFTIDEVPPCQPEGSENEIIVEEEEKKCAQTDCLVWGLSRSITGCTYITDCDIRLPPGEDSLLHRRNQDGWLPAAQGPEDGGLPFLQQQQPTTTSLQGQNARATAPEEERNPLKVLRSP